MFCSICERLRSFGSSKPPLVVFVFCIATLAVILVSFAYFVKVTELSDPEINEEWHGFLKNFASMEFCVYGNESEFTRITSPKPLRLDPKPMASPTAYPQNTSVSVQMLVEFEPADTFVPGSKNVTRLSATVRGDQLGFTGQEALQTVGMTFELPHPSNLSQCIKTKSCGVLKILTCINLLAPVGMFPSSRRPVCNVTDESRLEKSSHLLPQTKAEASSRRCQSKPIIRFKNAWSKAFTVMLSLNDRSLINLHLMHTSYFLFVMVIMLICYAAIRGSSRSRTTHKHTDRALLKA